MLLRYFLVCLVAVVVGIIIGFPMLAFCKRLKFSQPILHYVDKHTAKSGTPTMGGLIFIASSIISTLFFIKGQAFWAILSLIIMLCYGMLGFLDDFLKVRFHHNEGLKPYQKIIGQVGISLVVALYTYFQVGSTIDLFGVSLNMGIFIIPFIMIFFVAVTNSVNLMDGLDGLCASVSGTYLLFFGIILAVIGGQAFSNLAIAAFGMVGSLIAYLLFNGYPAKIFMGDTGSLALGGFIASLAVFSGLELILPIMGLLYVLTALSDILQVLHYKRTHKRIFKMAPLHHHFEQLGVHENRIVAIYIVITFMLGASCLLGYMAVMGVL